MAGFDFTLDSPPTSTSVTVVTSIPPPLTVEITSIINAVQTPVSTKVVFTTVASSTLVLSPLSGPTNTGNLTNLATGTQRTKTKSSGPTPLLPSESTDSSTHDNSTSSPNLAWIAGPVIGGVVAIALLTGLFFWLGRRLGRREAIARDEAQWGNPELSAGPKANRHELADTQRPAELDGSLSHEEAEKV